MLKYILSGSCYLTSLVFLGFMLLSIVQGSAVAAALCMVGTIVFFVAAWVFLRWQRQGAK